MKLSHYILILLFVTVGTAQADQTQCASNSLKAVLHHKPLHFNSAIQSGTYTGVLASNLFAPLLRINRQWEYSPNLANKWSVSEDGLSVTFKLVENGVFHDGEPIRSDDVAFSIETVRDYHPFTMMLDSVDSISTPDEFTVIVHLKYPSQQLLLVAASPMLPILPKHIYGDGRDITQHPANTAVVGSGPFQLVSNTNSGIVLQKFPEYFHKGLPRLDCLHFIYTTNISMKVAFETGFVQLEGFVSDVEDANKIESLPNYKVDYDGYGGIGPIRLIIFNLTHPPLDNLLVRQAIALSIDRNFIRENVYLEKVQVAHSAMHPDNPYYFDEVEKYEYNTELANQLLDQAGFPRGPDGYRFSITLDTGADPTGGYYLETSQYIQREFSRKLGIQVEVISNQGFSEYADRLSNYKYDMAFVNYFNWGDPVIGFDRIFDSKNIRKGVMFANMTNYANADVDQWLNDALIESDFQKRKQLYNNIQKTTAYELPIYPVTTLAFSTIYPENLKGMNNSIWGTMFPFDQIYWE